VPTPAAVLVGLGGATTILTAGAPVQVATVAVALVALLGFGWTAVATRPADGTAPTATATPPPAASATVGR
jgi:hypothetical protein